ncbi:rod-binding protein [Pseudobacteriovorax antillogorgiicola]|uniref:Rod binding protein n=1 Tax=Pseudobacteriovorax antillogorgiicola TaxID=1513793 RepID=A0A1Y6B6E4_9BACT|nr:rod-binding protein [Pseudobacteriovorax antillogorgiicola]TCS59529.1 rod binding protein [Pseudobacteriovorax antillogorgiicola]SME87827.1 Rod binding protein [Pseudobacteriovorax antillogorgiicola]
MDASFITNRLSLAQGESQLVAQKQALSTENQKDQGEIKRLSEQFESIFLGIVLKSMRKSVPNSGFIKKGNGEEIFRSMLDTEYAKSLASQRTTGLAESIENHLLGLMRQTTGQFEVTNKNMGLQHYQSGGGKPR